MASRVKNNICQQVCCWYSIRAIAKYNSAILYFGLKPLVLGQDATLL